MAETIGSLDDKIKLKATSRLTDEVLAAFPNQNIFDENTLVDLRGMSTIDGKYRISQLLTAIRSACMTANLHSYISKDVEDFIVKVEKLPMGEKP